MVVRTTSEYAGKPNTTTGLSYDENRATTEECIAVTVTSYRLTFKLTLPLLITRVHDDVDFPSSFSLPQFVF